MNKKIISFFVSFIVLFAVYAIADTVSDKEDAAIISAQKWLSIIDAEKYTESWTEAAKISKNSVSMEQWEQSLRAVRKSLGKLISRKLISKKYATSLPGAPDGEYVVIQFKTTFENKKAAVETVTPMMDKDGKWKVSGYYIK